MPSSAVGHHGVCLWHEPCASPAAAELPGYEGKGAFLVFYLVFVVQTCMVVQHMVGIKLKRPASAPPDQQELQLGPLGVWGC